MRNQKHPFEIVNSMISYVSEIAGLLGKLSVVSFISANPKLRRSNRIRIIHGSLAIEQNTLPIEQMTAVLNDKQVLTPPRILPKSRTPMNSMSGWMSLIPIR